MRTSRGSKRFQTILHIFVPCAALLTCTTIVLAQATSNCCHTQTCPGGGSLTHCTLRNCTENESCQGSGSCNPTTSRAVCARLNG